jgi:hypothetical protein
MNQSRFLEALSDRTNPRLSDEISLFRFAFARQWDPNGDESPFSHTKPFGLKSLEVAQVCEAFGQIGNLSDKGEAVLFYLFILGHDEDFVEESVDGGDHGDERGEEVVHASRLT